MPNSISDSRADLAAPSERALVMTAAAIILVGAVLWCARGSHPEKTDFSVTYVGAYIVRHGWGSHVYDLSFQNKIRDSLFRDPNPLVFEHPPFEALLLSPLAALPFRLAYMIWGFFNATVWLTLMTLLRPHLRWPRDEIAYVALWLLFAPLGVALFQGQSSLLVLAIFSITFLQLEESNEFSAGLVMGLALLKLQFALPFALIMLFRRKWRFLGGFACTSLILGALSLVAVGWNGAVSYVRLLLTVGNNPQNISYGSALDMPTLHGLIFAIFGGVLSHRALNITVVLLSILLLGFIARRWNALRDATAQGLMFASAVAACLLTSSHMFTHDFSPLILGLFLVGGAISEAKPARLGVLRVLSIATLVVFWTFPVYFACVAWHCMYLMCPVLLAFAFSAVLIAAQTRAEMKPEPEYASVG